MTGMEEARRNLDERVVDGFGDEWERFSNQELDQAELEAMFDDYTSIFPWEKVDQSSVGLDAGCGSGRWARFFARHVGRLHCVDASGEAIDVARRTLVDEEGVEFHIATLEDMPVAPESCDFGYSLGVLHHIPDTERALRACVERLKFGAPFLVYLYYDLEDAGPARRFLLGTVTMARAVTSRLPHRLRALATDVVALVVYLPFARMARLVERFGRDPSALPLFQYRHRSFYVMRNDALDRFGTRLEKRFSRQEVQDLLEGAGLGDVRFSDGPPWWVAVADRHH